MKYLGQITEDGNIGLHVLASVDDENKILNFVGYEVIDGKNMFDGIPIKYNAFVGGDKFTTQHGTFSRGDILSKTYDSADFDDISEGTCYSCSDCSIGHDTTDDYNSDFILDKHGALWCKSCIPLDSVLTEVTSPDDILKAGNATGIKKFKGYREVTTLFVDSSGFGQVGERALTLNQAKAQVQDMLKRRKKPLYAALTGIGQFQVYVTLFVKR